jgi:polyisoprenoid-binding protein YceI
MSTAVQVPGYVTGTWNIDPVHSEVSFSVRHMMVSKVRGRFGVFSGTVVTAADPLESSATASIDVSTIDTNNEQRDAHVRSADFFDAETHPTMTYRSTGLRSAGETFVLDGELTLRGVTRPVPLTVEVNGFGPDAYGGTRAGFTATAEINRHDFNVSFNAAIEGTGGMVLGDKVTIQLEIQAVLATDQG